MSIFGLITAAIFVNKIPQRSLLMLVTVLASLITFTFMLASSAEWFLFTSYLFGFTTTCIYKIAISVGSQQLASAPAVLVTFLLFSGNVGSTIAPILSGWVVQLFGVQSAIIMTWVGYTFVALVFGFCLLLEKRELRAHA
jgi:TsgA-like MFS transporter